MSWHTITALKNSRTLTNQRIVRAYKIAVDHKKRTAVLLTVFVIAAWITIAISVVLPARSRLESVAALDVSGEGDPLAR
jgi:hypothetical protein